MRGADFLRAVDFAAVFFVAFARASLRFVAVVAMLSPLSTQANHLQRRENHGKAVQINKIGDRMETLREVWTIISGAPDVIRAMLPWDVGDSQLLLWSSIALFVVIALVACQLFGWFFARALCWLLGVGKSGVR